MTNQAAQGATAAPGTPFEYTSVRVDRGDEPLYRDAYENFGWQVETTRTASPGAVMLQLKRDRATPNRSMLNDLQRRCESALAAIRGLERSRRSIASVVAWVIGLAGAVAMGGSVFGYEAGESGLSLALGAVGIALWLVPLLAFRIVRAGRSAQVASRIDQQFQTVYDTWTQASRLRA